MIYNYYLYPLTNERNSLGNRLKFQHIPQSMSIIKLNKPQQFGNQLRNHIDSNGFHTSIIWDDIFLCAVKSTVLSLVPGAVSRI